MLNFLSVINVLRLPCCYYVIQLTVDMIWILLKPTVTVVCTICIFIHPKLRINLYNNGYYTKLIINVNVPKSLNHRINRGESKIVFKIRTHLVCHAQNIVK